MDLCFQIAESPKRETPRRSEAYDKHADYLLSLVKDVVKFHKDYEYFHNQYKHGLAVAMRPFGNMYNQKQIDADKKGESKPYLTVYDNREFSQAERKGTFKGTALMVGFTDNVRPFIGSLAKESNFIRLVDAEGSNINIDLLVDVAYKVRTCINTFLSNYCERINPDKSELRFQLPIDHRTNQSLIISYRNE